MDTFESPNVIDAIQSNLNRRNVFFPNDLVVAVVGEHFKHAVCVICATPKNKQTIKKKQ